MSNLGLLAFGGTHSDLGLLLASISVISKEVGDMQASSIGSYVVYEFRPIGLLWDGRPLDSRLIVSRERGLEERLTT